MASTPPKQQPWKPKQIPHPRTKLKPGEYLFVTPSVQTHPTPCLALVGQSIANWSNIEWMLVSILAHISGMPDWSAADMFQEVRKLRPRIAILNKHFRKALGREMAEQINETYFKPLLTLSGERDRIAHANWLGDANYPDALIAVEQWGRDEQRFLYDIPTLTALSNEILARWFKLLDLWWRVMRASGYRPEAGGIVPGGIDPKKFDLLPATGAPADIQQPPQDLVEGGA